MSQAPESSPAHRSHPRIDPEAKFTPRDFAALIEKLPEDCALAGGQAVAFWAERYDVKARVGPVEQPVTSRDIDFWAGRAELLELGRRLNRKPVFPHEYEMTVWAGAIELIIQGRQTAVDFLHTIPGLDTNNPDDACIEQEFQTQAGPKRLLVLSPISLVLCKLHALRHFDQSNRADLLHLTVCIETSKHFTLELLKAGHVKMALWNCQRLIACHRLKATHRLEHEHNFRVLTAVPIEQIKQEAHNPEQNVALREKLARFHAIQWPRALKEEK